MVHNYSTCCIYTYNYIIYNCHGSSTESPQSKSRNRSHSPSSSIVSTCLDPTPGPPRTPDIFHGEGSEFEENSTGRSLKLHLESHHFFIQVPPRSRGEQPVTYQQNLKNNMCDIENIVQNIMKIIDIDSAFFSAVCSVSIVGCVCTSSSQFVHDIFGIVSHCP